MTTCFLGLCSIGKAHQHCQAKSPHSLGQQCQSGHQHKSLILDRSKINTNHSNINEKGSLPLAHMNIDAATVGLECLARVEVVVIIVIVIHTFKPAVDNEIAHYI